MMIYTSYFAMLKQIPENFLPVSIAAKPPSWYKGACYRRLAPSFNILSEYKRSGDWERYVERYNREVLGKISVHDAVRYLQSLRGYSTRDIVLLCYERPGSFCHRQLVADWLEGNGYSCEELVVTKGIKT